MLYTGIDLHRHVIALCTVNESGTVLARSRIKTDPEAILTYFHQWSEPHRAVVESTSGWYWFCDLLHTAGIDIILAHAKYLKAISYAKVKTDAVDAHTLAQLLRMGFIPVAYQLPMDGNQYLKYAFTEVAIKAMMYYPEIKQFAEHVTERANKTIARTVVAKELAKCVYYVLTHQEEFKTFKGIEITKLRDWPRARPALQDAVRRHKPVRLIRRPRRVVETRRAGAVSPMA